MKNKIRELIERNDRNDRNGEDAPIPVPTRCLICNLLPEKRAEIDQALTEEGLTLGAVVRRFRLSKASIWRHAKNHVLPQVKSRLEQAFERAGVLQQTVGAVVDQMQTTEDLRAFVARAELTSLYWKVKRHIQRAEDAKDYQTLRWSLSEGRQMLELAGRFDGAFTEAGNKITNIVILAKGDVQMGQAPQLPAEPPEAILATITDDQPPAKGAWHLKLT